MDLQHERVHPGFLDPGQRRLDVRRAGHAVGIPPGCPSGSSSRGPCRRPWTPASPGSAGRASSARKGRTRSRGARGAAPRPASPWSRPRRSRPARGGDRRDDLLRELDALPQHDQNEDERDHEQEPADQGRLEDPERALHPPGLSPRKADRHAAAARGASAAVVRSSVVSTSQTGPRTAKAGMIEVGRSGAARRAAAAGCRPARDLRARPSTATARDPPRRASPGSITAAASESHTRPAENRLGSRSARGTRLRQGRCRARTRSAGPSAASATFHRRPLPKISASSASRRREEQALVLQSPRSAPRRSEPAQRPRVRSSSASASAVPKSSSRSERHLRHAGQEPRVERLEPRDDRARRGRRRRGDAPRRRSQPNRARAASRPGGAGRAAPSRGRPSGRSRKEMPGVEKRQAERVLRVGEPRGSCRRSG